LAKKKDYITIDNRILIGIAVLFGLILFFSLPDKKEVAPDVPESPKEIKQLTATVLGMECEICYQDLVEWLLTEAEETPNTNLTKNFVRGKTADILIEKYNITKIPAIVITGDINKVSLVSRQRYETREDALVFTTLSAPHIDTRTKELKGIVNATILNHSKCPDCMFNLAVLLVDMKNFPVHFENEFTVDAESKEGEELISKYGIEKIPTVIFNNEILAYNLPWAGFENQTDGSVVLKGVLPPYFDLGSGQLKDGNFSSTYLIDSTCSGCFNVSLIKDTLPESFGIILKDATTIDIALEGKDFAEKHNIANVPTLVIGPAASDYPLFDEVWAQYGHTAESRSHIFSEYNLLSEQGEIVYKNLETGEIVKLDD